MIVCMRVYGSLAVRYVCYCRYWIKWTRSVSSCIHYRSVMMMRTKITRNSVDSSRSFQCHHRNIITLLNVFVIQLVSASAFTSGSVVLL